MAYCSTERLANKTTISQLDQKAEITISLKKDTSPCDFALLRNLSGNGQYRRVFPSDTDDCLNTFCRQDGFTVPNSNDAISGILINGGGTYSPDSVATFKLFFPAPVQSASTFVMKLYNGSSSSNSNNYEVSIPAGTVGWQTYFIYLGTPTSVTGSGLTDYSGSLSYIFQVNSTPAVSYTVKYIGWYGNYIETRFEEVIKVACIGDASLTHTAEVLQNLCEKAKYDDTNKQPFELNLTVGEYTPNFLILNPFVSQGANNQGIEKVSYSYEVAADGSVQLDDVADLCGFIYVEKQNCGTYDDALHKTMIKEMITADNYTEFFFDKEESKVYVTPSYAGQNITISYLKKAEVQEFVLSSENLNEHTAEVIFSMNVGERRNLDKYTFIFKNVLVSSFTIPLKSDNGLQLNLSINEDENKEYGRIQRKV